MSLDDFLLSPALGEEMYARYKDNPSGLDPSLKELFDTLGSASLPKLTRPKAMGREWELGKEARIIRLFDFFRREGYRFCEVNPLEKKLPLDPTRILQALGFNNESELFPTMGLFPQEERSVREIFEALASKWANKIAIQFYDFCLPEIVQEIVASIEKNNISSLTTLEDKGLILEGLSKADIFETFVHTRYTGQKRFSLEGAETLIPMLESAVMEARKAGAEEVYIGMAHRGRLNVLSNILGKSAKEIFSEFDEGYIPDQFEGSGDVKYHKGFEGTLKGVRLFLTSNPSHLESVDPVLLGQTRARQEGYPEKERRQKVVPLLIHGDGAISGQGVVYETLQMQKLAAYETGGVVHIVINNQIGFTTLPEQLRSTPYCTDIAKAFGSPVFRISVENPEEALFVMRLALQLRDKFRQDVFIDLIGWRKWGHNEGDEPAFTQPALYREIKKNKSPRESYLERLKLEGKHEAILADSIEEEFKKSLQRAKESAQVDAKEIKFKIREKESWKPPQLTTQVSKEILYRAADLLSSTPNAFLLHPKVEQLMKERKKALIGDENQKKIDWGCAEAAAYATLILEGRGVRLTGQDVERGTFSHRHLRVFNQMDQRGASPLDAVPGFAIYNSHLSEMAALGFEYGYSLQKEGCLTIWEAQFGDFANGAQVIIDQYIAAGEEKWGQRSSLTLLLPHGYEGQGPEHSSARIERFMTLCAHNNLRLANPTTPAQFFHLVRRQALDPEKKPLVIFTPKALLRLPECTSSPKELMEGSFLPLIDDLKVDSAKRLLLCSGKIYYELIGAREKSRDTNTAIVRIEQLYPLYQSGLQEIFKRHATCEQIYFVQEEPANMGPWPWLGPALRKIAEREIILISRDESAASAAGHMAYHKAQLKEIFRTLFSNPDQGLFDIQGHMRA